MNLPVVNLVCTTYNRDKLLSRILTSFQEQTYEGNVNLVVFNSGSATTFPSFDLPENKKVILINRKESLETGLPYSSIGDKYNDAVALAPEADIFSSFDADDLFFPNHVEEGVKGMEKAYSLGKKSFKPKKSFFKSGHIIGLNENVYEPSIFADYKFVKEKGFGKGLSVKYHDSWVHPLVEQGLMLVDSQAPPTFLYDWSQSIPTYKMSGKLESQENFNASQKMLVDKGSGVTKPIPRDEYLKQIEEVYNIFPPSNNN